MRRWTTAVGLGIACLAALLFVATPAAEAKLSYSKKGKRLRTVAAKDWLRHPSKASYYTESWTTILRSTEGHVLYVTFVYSNIGVVSGNTAVNVRYVAPGKRKAKSYRFNHGTGDFGQNPATGRIVIAKNSMVLNGREIQLKVKEDGVTLDASIEGWMDGVQFHDGKVFVDDEKKEYMQTFFHVPRGNFRATLKAGGKTIKMTGDAYVDHAIQTSLSTDFSTRWHTLRLFSGEHTLAFISFDLDEERGGGRLMRMILTDRTKVLAFSDKLRLRPGGMKKDPKGHRYATRFAVSYKDKTLALKGKIKSKGLHDREAFMEDLSWVERQVAEMVAGNPIVYRMHAEADLTLTPNGAEPLQLTGPAIIESIIMKDENPEPEKAEGK